VSRIFSHNISEVIREGDAPQGINGRGDSYSNTGMYTIQLSDINGFTIRCYNKNFDPSTPGAVVSQQIFPNCEYLKLRT